MRNCKHGFNPIDGPGLWCPACEAEKQESKKARRTVKGRITMALIALLILAAVFGLWLMLDEPPHKEALAWLH